MGRFYNGEISGKLWFGIQESDDASHFGKEHTDVYCFYVCNCYLNINDAYEGIYSTSCHKSCEEHTQLMPEGMYCTSCYNSYEEHKQAMLDEDCDDTETWHLSESEISYAFDESDIDTIQETIHDLEDYVGKYMGSYCIDEDMNYSYDLPSDLTEDEITCIARLCLGKQILHCLQKNGSCNFTAEL